MHTVKETDMLTAKLDLLIKKLDEGNRQQMLVPIHAMNSYFTCKVCGDGGHLGNDCPETREDAAYINNNNIGFCSQREDCSAAILNQPPKKKKDPGCPTIDWHSTLRQFLV